MPDCFVRHFLYSTYDFEIGGADEKIDEPVIISKDCFVVRRVIYEQ